MAHHIWDSMQADFARTNTAEGVLRRFSKINTLHDSNHRRFCRDYLDVTPAWLVAIQISDNAKKEKAA